MTVLYESRMPLSGGDLAFTSAGTSKEVLLLIHGLGGDRQTWRHLIPGLARTHTVIALDLPGHGDSDPPAPACQGELSPLVHSKPGLT